MLGFTAPGVCTQVLLISNCQQHRNMATLKTIFLRRKSVKNIQKITQSMKMVSAAKYTRAERDLKMARPYGEGVVQFYEKLEATPQDEKPKQLYIAMTSDRGLCGAVHTGVSKAIRSKLAEPGAENIKVICVGDKSRIGRLPPSFGDASVLANAVLTSGYEFSSGKIVFNRFLSVVSYKQSELPLFSQKSVESAQKLATYDSIDAEVLQSYMEFSLTSMIFYALKEGACSEQSSRMTAMNNASKNAGEMIEKLNRIYNRTRQSVITRELIEIISGAAALEEK